MKSFLDFTLFAGCISANIAFFEAGGKLFSVWFWLYAISLIVVGVGQYIKGKVSR